MYYVYVELIFVLLKNIILYKIIGIVLLCIVFCSIYWIWVFLLNICVYFNFYILIYICNNEKKNELIFEFLFNLEYDIEIENFYLLIKIIIIFIKFFIFI